MNKFDQKYFQLINCVRHSYMPRAPQKTTFVSFILSGLRGTSATRGTLGEMRRSRLLNQLNLFVKSNMKSIIILIILIVFTARQSHGQFLPDNYTSLQFGIGNINIDDHNEKANLRLSLTRNNLIPLLFYQIGIDFSHKVPFDVGFHSYGYFNVGHGINYRYFTILYSAGPSLSFYKFGYSSVIDLKDSYSNDANKKYHFRPGINGNMVFIIKPISKFGLGVDLFYNTNLSGSIYGSSFILYFTNK